MPKRKHRYRSDDHAVRRIRKTSDCVVYRDENKSLKLVATALSIFVSLLGIARWAEGTDVLSQPHVSQPIQHAVARTSEYRVPASYSPLPRIIRQHGYFAEFGAFGTRDEAMRWLAISRQSNPYLFNHVAASIAPADRNNVGVRYVLRSRRSQDHSEITSMCQHIQTAGVTCLKRHDSRL